MFFRNNTGGAEWLLVGLGNPGTQYENTRHNVGFLVADELAERQNAPIQRLKFKALTNLLTISGEKVLVMKPVTYMNLSGEAVRQAVDFYKIPPERVLVVSDDTALAVGRIWAAVGAGLGALQNFIRIRPGQITVQPDYTGDEERKASFSCKITGCLFIMVSVGIWAFRRLKEQKFL